MKEEPFSRTIVRYYMNSHIGLSCIDMRVKRVLGLKVRQVSRAYITLSRLLAWVRRGHVTSGQSRGRLSIAPAAGSHGARVPGLHEPDRRVFAVTDRLGRAGGWAQIGQFLSSTDH